MKKILLSLLILSMYSPPVQADYTTVDIGSYINTAGTLNPTTFPKGLSTGNTGTGIPFYTSTLPSSSNMGFALLGAPTVLPTGITLKPGAPTGLDSELTINLSSYNLSGQVSFYLLLNNYYGNAGLNEYTVNLNFNDSASQSYNSIGGADTRDFNNNPAFTNTISNTTTGN